MEKTIQFIKNAQGLLAKNRDNNVQMAFGELTKALNSLNPNAAKIEADKKALEKEKAEKK